MCELLIGLREVRLLGVIDVVGDPLVIVIEQRVRRPVCSSCGAAAQVKERPHVTFADLAACVRRRSRSRDFSKAHPCGKCVQSISMTRRR